MPGPAQEITLHNKHDEQGDPYNLWKVQFAAKVAGLLADNHHRVMYTVLTQDQWAGDIFKLMDYLTEKKLNPGLPKVWIYATNVPAMMTSADKWMLDSMDTLHERKYS